MQTILDFHIRAESQTGYRLELFARDGSQPLAAAQFDLPVSFLTGYELSGLEPDGKDPAARVERLKAYGSKLYQKLFASEDVRRVWEIQKASADFLTLCLRTAPDAVALEALPWEALHDGSEFLAAGLKTGVSRLPLEIAPSAELPAVPLPVRMLALVASPLDLPEGSRLQIEREQEILLEAVNTPAGQGKLFVDFEDEAKLDILEHSLEAGYHIFHFTGHGIPPEDGGGLLLEDAAGKQRATSVGEMITSLQKGAATLRLVVLSGCQTARTLHTGGFNDLARGLARGLQGMPKIPAVLAMQFSITDAGGLMLAEKLYPRLLEGQPLEIALSRTRRDLLLSDDPYLQGDAIAPVLLVSNGRCLQSRAAELPDAPQSIEPDFSFHLPLAQHSFGFYGRRHEYRQLCDALVQRNQRAVIIHGIGGIGKTALVSHAATRLRKRFRGVYAFDCGGGTLAPERVIAELHRYFELQNIQALQRLAYQPLPPEVLATHLAQVLAQWPMLLIFDNFETQLERTGDDFRISDEALRAFLTTLVKATATGSRFLFTSRYLFDVGDKRLGNIQSLPLGDMSRSEALMMMQKLPNLAAATHSEKLAAYQTFGGHPYALVALDRHCNFRKLSDALADASALHTELREFLAIEINYTQLSDDARELLNRLAAFRLAVPLAAAEWMMGEKVSYAAELLKREDRSNWPDEVKALSELEIVERLEQQLPERRQSADVTPAITALIEWGLLMPIVAEGQLHMYAVHSLVRDFCRELQEFAIWRRWLRDAATFYTNLTKLAVEDSKNAQAIFCDIEAFELFSEANEYEIACSVLFSVSKYLMRWGDGRYLNSKFTRLLGKVVPLTEARIKHDLGALHLQRGEFTLARDWFEKSIQMKEGLDEPSGLALSYCQLGIVFQQMGDFEYALQCLQKSQAISSEIGFKSNLASSHLHIGQIYQVRGDYVTAKDHYQKSLGIYEELGRRADKAQVLHQIGTVFHDLGEHNEALASYKEAISISEEAGDKDGLSISVHQIGMLYHQQGNYEAALNAYQYSLKLAEEVGDLQGIAGSFHQIGMIFQDLRQYEEALAHYQKAEGLFEYIGDRAGLASARSQQGLILIEQQRFQEAFEFLKYAYDFFAKLKLESANNVANGLRYLRTLWGNGIELGQ